MKPTTPFRILISYGTRIRDSLVPIRKTEIDGIKFYYSRGNEPQDPLVMGLNREMHYELDQMTGATAIDVGAHIGSYTLRLARRFQRVIAFEPNPSIRHLLKLNIQLNKMQNVDVEDAALSDSDGSSPLFVQRSTGGTASLNPLHYGFDYDATVQVRVKRLDEFEIDNVDVLKIDSEGNELRVLKGASRTIDRTRPVVAVEVHQPKDPYGATCYCQTCEYLRSLSYDLKVLGEYAKTPAHWVVATPADKKRMHKRNNQK